MVIYKAPLSAASDVHGASPHNNQNNKLKSWAYKQAKIIYKDVESHNAIQTQLKFKQMLPSINMSSSFS